jgi:iron only hydrogenase large subunit-like protein
MTSSCCPAYTAAVERHFKGLAPYVSHTESPMVALARQIRAADPEAIVVFVGPCLAKKREAAGSGVIDYSISFEELGAMFVAHEIDVQTCEAVAADTVGQNAGRGFPVTGGVSSAVAAALADREDVTVATIDGIDADAARLLRRLAKDPEKASNRPDGATFLEVMACPGGCVGGPLAYGSAKSASRQIAAQAAETATSI